MSTRTPPRALFALLAAIVLALGVAACGGDDDHDEGGGDTSANLIEENPDNNGVQGTGPASDVEGEYRGHQGMRQAMERFDKAWRDWQLDTGA